MNAALDTELGSPGRGPHRYMLGEPVKWQVLFPGRSRFVHIHPSFLLPASLFSITKLPLFEF